MLGCLYILPNIKLGLLGVRSSMKTDSSSLWICICKFSCTLYDSFCDIYMSDPPMERYGVSVCIQSKCGKMRTRATPNMDTFHVANVLCSNVKLFSILMLYCCSNVALFFVLCSMFYVVEIAIFHNLNYETSQITIILLTFCNI